MRKSNTGSKQASLDKGARCDERPRHRSKRHATFHCDVGFAGPPRPEQNTARPKQTIGTCATYVGNAEYVLTRHRGCPYNDARASRGQNKRCGIAKSSPQRKRNRAHKWHRAKN